MNKFYVILISGLFLLLFITCNEEKVLVNGETPFAIRDVRIPEFISSTTDKKVLITAHVTHPEGSEGISQVNFMIGDSSGQVVKTLPMFDDGSVQDTSSGDVIAFDNIYSITVIGSGLGLINASYQSWITAEDASGEIRKSEIREVEIFPNQPPEIISVVFPDSIKSGMQPQEIFIEASDNEGIDDIRWILIEGIDIGTGFVVFRDTIPNPMNNSPVFTRMVDSSYAAGKKGLLELSFIAEDRVGDFSEPVLREIFFENGIPVGFNPVVPDTLILPASPSEAVDTLVTLNVRDPQSLADIDEVYFYSLKPDSTLANNGNPLVMWDNGLPFLGDPVRPQYAGDQIAGDGIYSLTILLFGNALPGRYVFSFYARDRVNQESIVVVDSIFISN
ncbi:MAG: hypothetical protein EH225_11900 [Calditrichaeota bacterium]|nr:hypothetical protein [Calditrichota bacterium]RQV99240.1 MAG: hypothetical protein EH225_11900 [Calditrichota bacterium]